MSEATVHSLCRSRKTFTIRGFDAAGHASHGSVLQLPDVDTVAHRIWRSDGSYTWFVSRDHFLAVPPPGPHVGDVEGTVCGRSVN